MNQEATPCPGFDAVLADAAKVLWQCEDNQRLFDEGTESSVLFDRSVYYWVCYPDLFKRIWLAESTGVEVSMVEKAASALNDVHKTAVIWLMDFAEQAGLDSAPIHAAGNLCRILYRTDFSRFFAADQSAITWPETLGSTFSELPESQQQLILAAEALLQRCVGKIRGEKPPATSSPPSTEAGGQGAEEEPAKKTASRPQSGRAKKIRNQPRAAILVEQAVRNYHKFDGGVVDRTIPPISGRDLAEQSNGAFAARTADRWFVARFGSKEEYETACLNGTLGKRLAINGDDIRAFGSFDQSEHEVTDSDDDERG